MSHKYFNGDHVLVIENDVCRRGVVGSVIDAVNPPILLVKFADSDEYEKVTIDKVVPEPVNERPNADE